MQDSQLDLFAPAEPLHLQRILARSSDRVSWLRHRAMGVTATDAARLSSPKALQSVAWEKRTGGNGFSGNRYTDHGKEREPHIAKWVAERFPLESSDALFHSTRERRHLATPDGLSVDGLTLCEIKTTSKPLRKPPANYLRQIWWQQYVLGAERTLFVWEQHRDFAPLGEPQYLWIDRNDSEIEVLVQRANLLLQAMGTSAP
ncbi:YqaJ viral recombinase family protein [uncultured Agrococcus sp.]|uniref:YqaJ viral recombinase family protein n=1 Tax=uncultured Agrococcus sp. TaxID=382258 RepID=UPI0025E743F5|nr:YqaJ viral recombinase family protein [uncultured Agrococcus sp.]